MTEATALPAAPMLTQTGKLERFPTIVMGEGSEARRVVR